MTSTNQLRRVLGPVGATMVVVGAVIGAGVFFKARVIAQSVGRMDLVILVWVVCGLVSLCGALAVAELAAAIPHAGGQYVYLRRAYGPLAGFLVVVASFYINDDQSTATLLMGFVLMFVSATAVGLLNGVLIRFGNFTAIAATLAVYMGLQGASFLLRESPDGYINSDVSDWITWKIGAFPVAFIALALFAIIGEYVLRKTRAGWQHRAIGSSEESARRIGIRINRKFVLGYVLCSLLTACGAVLLMAEWGTGDPRQGAPLTLSSITAVVLGGTSLRGGRGTFIGTVLGAVLLSEVLKAVVFLDLTQTYQYVFQGALIVAAALIYSLARGRSGQG